MNNLKKYNNYELYPCTEIDGYNKEAFAGSAVIVQKLKERIAHEQKTKSTVTLCMDLYPGVDKQEIIAIAKQLAPSHIFDMEDYAYSKEELDKTLEPFLTDDRVFGIICHKRLEEFFDKQKLEKAKSNLKEAGLNIIIGVGADILCHGDIYVYCDITRWEIQLRYRKGMTNWHCDNKDAPILSKYKRGFFVEWKLADRYKKQRFEQFDYLLETEAKDSPKMITGDAFRSALKQLSQKPFRMEPYFDPGVWGGHWMQNQFGLDSKKPNFAWSFDGVPEENSINLRFGEVDVKVPTMDLVLYCPRELLGERVHGRFGAEFPIRFDLLDTMGGGNLSLQVHPLTEYVQDTFGMHYTQDESYYILDADESADTFVYLGVKKNIDKEAMAADLKKAELGEMEFPAEKYVNKLPIKKHDHILIPAGTIHCSGKDTMVLEISATPYIFTFKLWDWGRLGLDGIPRPVHIEHGLKNIQWDRDTDWLFENVIHMEKTLEEENGMKLERTGLHNREFIDTFRYTLTKPKLVHMNDSVHMMNLVEGESVRIVPTADNSAEFELHYAETCIVPASVGSYKIVPTGADEIKLIVAAIRE